MAAVRPGSPRPRRGRGGRHRVKRAGVQVLIGVGQGDAGAQPVHHEVAHVAGHVEGPLPSPAGEAHGDPTLVEAPSLFSEDPLDPDTLLGWSQSYAGEVLALDSCLHWLRSEMENHAGLADSMFITTAPRGFPLGIHGHVGNCCPALFSDLLQVPAFIQREGASPRGGFSTKPDTRTSAKTCSRRATANVRCVARPPRLLPSATATVRADGLTAVTTCRRS